MEVFYLSHKTAILASFVTVSVFLLVRFASVKMILKIGRINDFMEARTRLIIRYVSVLLLFLGIGTLTLVWGVNFKELGLIFSSVFAVIGVALFAQWSILSNLTAGVILFFSFPFKIGDHIKIMDKDMIESGESELPIFEIVDITAYHMHLHNIRGELITYPNNMLLQKPVSLVNSIEKEKSG